VSKVKNGDKNEEKIKQCVEKIKLNKEQAIEQYQHQLEEQNVKNQLPLLQS